MSKYSYDDYIRELDNMDIDYTCGYSYINNEKGQEVMIGRWIDIGGTFDEPDMSFNFALSDEE